MIKYYCYTGDIKKLLPAGYKFQLLYASNYKSYTKNNIIMFIISKMKIEIDNINCQRKVIQFILDNKNKPSNFWHSSSSMEIFKGIKFANWVVQNGQIVSRIEAVKLKSIWYKDYKKDDTVLYLEDGERIDYKLVQSIIELDMIGKVSLVEFN